MPTKNGGAKRAKGSRTSSDPSVSYDELKTYEGQKYTGMKIGRSHKWYYDKGEWKEKKITPDLWEISYAVTKRRAGHAPEGSGVPVGTEYHWYILAHQNVRKLNADDYTTSLAGYKFKVAHKRADSEKWSATPKTQRKRMITFLREMISELESQREDVPAAAEEASTKPSAKTRKRAAARSTPVKKPATPRTTKSDKERRHAA